MTEPTEKLANEQACDEHWPVASSPSEHECARAAGHPHGHICGNCGAVLADVGEVPALRQQGAELQSKLDMPCGSCHPCANYGGSKERNDSLLTALESVEADRDDDHCGHVLSPCGCPQSPDPDQAYLAACSMLEAAKAERDALQARLTAVLALHFTRGRNILGQPVCNECSPLQPMPCRTVRAAASGQEGQE